MKLTLGTLTSGANMHYSTTDKIIVRGERCRRKMGHSQKKGLYSTPWEKVKDQFDSTPKILLRKNYFIYLDLLKSSPSFGCWNKYQKYKQNKYNQ